MQFKNGGFLTAACRSILRGSIVVRQRLHLFDPPESVGIISVIDVHHSLLRLAHIHYLMNSFDFSKKQSDDLLRKWRVGSKEYLLGRFPMIMGIVNVTPDSFSDGGHFLETQTAVKHALSLSEQGADILDIGGESTRPGSESIPAAEEIQRVIPVIEQVGRQTDVPMSIDTTKAEVARQAIQAGAVIVNDVSGLGFDTKMAYVCRDADVGVICVHMQGVPQTMQDNPTYDDVVGEICGFFSQRLQALENLGIPRERLVLDPGIGFGKTSDHNLEILANIRRFHDLGRPVLVGHSRKRFLASVLDCSVDDRTHGTLGVAVALAMQSTDIIRVHDVQATRNALLAWHAIADRLDTN